MGGRGASSSGGATGGIDLINATTTSLISAREGKRTEVDDTLRVLRDIQDMYGVDVEDVQLATIKGKGARVMAYYDSAGNLAVNQAYFNSERMQRAYDGCVDNGFHPSRGDKTAMEAVVAHEMGHRLNDVAAGGWGNLDATADKIVAAAAKRLGYRGKKGLASQISGYAQKSNAEAVAEAFADVYCNGGKASRESRAIVAELNKYFGK